MSSRQFYRRVLSVALPIMIQNGITNFVQMLDNVMVGQVGTIPMSGVAIVNQLVFVFNLCIFGAASGAGIFTAQFKGREDQEGIRHTFRFKILVGMLLSAVGIGVFLTFGRELIALYLTGEGTPEDAALTMEFGQRYLKVMLFGLLPFAACFVGAAEAVKLAVLGGVVFTATAWLFTSIQDRLSSGPACKAAPVVSAFGLYLACQCFMGMTI